MTTSTNLIAKHRPVNFDDVIGQDKTVKSFQAVLDKQRSQCFIFEGPAGTGKTTLARIGAGYVETSAGDLLEIDAATHSGIEKMRDVQLTSRYKPMGGPSRSIIIDEAHALSRNAWDSLLKVIEEPNPNVFWFFCTTNVAKIPKTIQTRCTKYKLSLLNERDLEDVVDRVCKKEDIDISDGIMQVIVREAEGSPRQAIANLVVAADAKSAKDATEMLRAVRESEPVRQLCQFIMRPGSWPKAMLIVDDLKDDNPEGVRIQVVNYLGAVLKGAKSEKDAAGALNLLEAFATPYNSAEGIAPLLLSIGRAVMGA